MIHAAVARETNGGPLEILLRVRQNTKSRKPHKPSSAGRERERVIVDGNGGEESMVERECLSEVMRGMSGKSWMCVHCMGRQKGRRREDATAGLWGVVVYMKSLDMDGEHADGPDCVGIERSLYNPIRVYVCEYCN